MTVPIKTIRAFKLFRTRGGKLHPLYVLATKAIPVGEWIDAEEGIRTPDGKVKSRLGSLHYRPGFHSGDLPMATHIGGKSQKGLKAPDYRPADQVWAEVELPDDVDWQAEANRRGYNSKGKFVAGRAEISDQIPVGGCYRYKTNPNMSGWWLISGSMRVLRVLTDDEVKAINDAAGVADLPRL